jgi:hypothetical protein
VRCLDLTKLGSNEEAEKVSPGEDLFRSLHIFLPSTGQRFKFRAFQHLWSYPWQLIASESRLDGRT